MTLLKIEITVNDEVVDVKSIRSQFLIVERGGILIWRGDNETPKQGHGVIHIWINYRLSNEYEIVFVRPDWQLKVGNTTYPLDTYQKIPIGEQGVELQYQNYRFVCSRQAETADTLSD